MRKLFAPLFLTLLACSPVLSAAVTMLESGRELIAAADIDLDGQSDIAIVDRTAGSIRVAAASASARSAANSGWRARANSSRLSTWPPINCPGSAAIATAGANSSIASRMGRGHMALLRRFDTDDGQHALLIRRAEADLVPRLP